MEFPILKGILAEVTRHKPNDLRSKEEHQWVSIDFRLHPWLYPRNFEVVEDMGLSQNDIQRIWKLPSLLQHAFRFLTNDVELEVHRILNKYYDRPFNDICPFDSTSTMIDQAIDLIISMQSIGAPILSTTDLMNVVTNQDLVVTLSECVDKDCLDERKNRVFETIIDDRDIGDLESHLKSQPDLSLIYVQDSQSVRITDCIVDDIQKDKVHRYQIEIRNDHRKKLGSIHVTIIFQGSFCDNTYSPGRLSAALYHVSNNDQIENIGVADYQVQNLNTTQGIGRLVIEYQTQNAFDNEILYLDVLASSSCHYSITLSGVVNYQLHAFAMSNMSRFYSLEKEIQSITLETDNLKLDCQLREFSIVILNDLVDLAENEKNKLYEDILRSEYQLESDDSVDYFVVENKIRTLERELSRQERLRQARMDMIRSMADENTTVTKQIGVLKSAIETKSHYSSALRSWLPYAFSSDESIREKVHVQMRKEYQRRNTFIDTAIETARLMTKDEINLDSTAYGRAILREITRISCQFTKLVNSSFLHRTTQLYPKDYLIYELERNLKVFLSDVISRKEAMHPLLLASFDNENDIDTFIDTFDSENSPFVDREESKQFNPHPDREETFCAACRTAPCNRIDVGDIQSIKKERETLTNLILELRRDKVHLSKQDPKDGRLEIISQSIQSHRKKAHTLDAKIKLDGVDKELHDIYKSNRNGNFIVRSLHQYDCLMEKNTAIIALEKEHDHLVAYQCAQEIFDEALRQMEEGWVFGEIIEDTNPAEGKYTVLPQTQQDLITNIHRRSHKALDLKQSHIHRRNITSFLDSIEKSIRIGLVCWLIRYIRAMSAIRFQKVQSAAQLLTSQRIEMIREEEMAKERDARRIEAYEKARVGSLRIKQRHKYRREIIVRDQVLDEKTAVLKQSSAVMIQKHYRRYLGKKAFCLWKTERESIQAWNALCHASSIAISRYWRGYVARVLAQKLRADMVEYLLNMRKIEVDQDEDEYWNSLKFGKYRRQRYTRKKTRDQSKIHNNVVKMI